MRDADRVIVRRALHGRLTVKKREETSKGVSVAVKRAVKKTIARNKNALRALADY